MNYYNEIKNKLINNEIYSKVKDYSEERNKVITYFEIGKLLAEAGGKYGDKVIEEYSKKLMLEVGKKYNKRTLFRMKQFYNVFNSDKVSTAWTQLTWSHLRLLLSLDVNSINYYIKIIVTSHISVRQLQEKIKNQEYERLDDKTKQKLIENKENEIEDYIKHPILIKNTNNDDDISEKVLQKIILDDMENFLTELGEGYCFIKSEYKIKLEDTFNFIDILLFNIKFNCYTVVELKTTKLKKEHIGQIETYMNYIDTEIKSIYHNPTIGIIICKENNKYVIKYCSNPNIYQTTYLTVNEEEKEYI